MSQRSLRTHEPSNPAIPSCRIPSGPTRGITPQSLDDRRPEVRLYVLWFRPYKAPVHDLAHALHTRRGGDYPEGVLFPTSLGGSSAHLHHFTVRSVNVNHSSLPHHSSANPRYTPQMYRAPVRCMQSRPDDTSQSKSDVTLPTKVSQENICARILGHDGEQSFARETSDTRCGAAAWRGD